MRVEISKFMHHNILRGVICVAAILLATSGYAKSKSKLSYPQVATGQVSAYDADGAVANNLKSSDPLYGQDAHYLAGAKMSYKNNGDGTISDLNTGLMWQMVPVKQGFNWQGAKDYCESLELAGYDDWRLPSAKELYSISDFGTGWPYLNREYFELINNERVGKDEQYWTSHMYVGTLGDRGSSSAAFGVNHGTGHIKAYGAGGAGGGGGQRPQMGQGGRPQGGQGQRPQMAQGQRPPMGDGQRPPRDTTAMAQGQRPPMGGGQRPPRDTTAMAQGQRPPMMGDGQRPPRDTTAMAQGQRPPMGGGQRPQMAQGQRQGQGQGQQRPPMAQGGQRGGNPSHKYVRAVRGSEYGVNKFSDNGDGTVTDKATGLMWSKLDSKKGMDWVVSLQYAKESKLAGYDDWRLPNVKELQGILSYDYSPSSNDPAKRRAAIDPIFECSEFKNEHGDRDIPYYWSGTSAIFQRGRPYYYAWYVAFGRAVDPSGLDNHGAGAVRFDTKHKGGPAGEDKARIYNYVRLVRSVE